MQKRKKGNSWAGALLLVTLLCTGAFFLARSIAGSRGNSLHSAIQTPAMAGQMVQPLGEGVLYYDGANLHALDGRARQVWSSAAGTNAGFSIGSGGVATWSGSTLNILSKDQGTSLFSGKMNDTILDARAGKVFTAVQVGDEHDSKMVLVNSDGRQYDEIELPNATVLDFGFFNDDKLFWVMSLNTEGTVPVCTISPYRPDKMLLGRIEDNQQVLYEVVFQSSLIRAVGTNHVKDYEYTGKEIEDNRMLVYGWYLMSMDEDDVNPMMAFVPIDQSDGSTGISDVRMIRGQVEQTVRLPYTANRVLVKDDTIYAFNGQYVMVCQMGQTKPVTYSLPIYVDMVLGMTQNKTCVATSGGMVYLIPLP